MTHDEARELAFVSLQAQYGADVCFRVAAILDTDPLTLQTQNGLIVTFNEHGVGTDDEDR